MVVDGEDEFKNPTERRRERDGRDGEEETEEETSLVIPNYSTFYPKTPLEDS